MSGGIKIIYCATLLAFAFGCSEKPVKANKSSKPELAQQHRRESLTVIISATETNITTSGRIRFMMDVHAPADTEVTFPNIGAFIESFRISGSHIEPQQSLPNRKILHRQIWVLVPTTHGTSTLGSMPVTAGTASISTDPITIQVKSILPPDLENLTIKDIAEPVVLLPRQRWQQRLWLFALSTAVTATLIAVIIRRSNRKKIVSAIPPDEAALQALGHLPAEQMARLHELSRILIEYLSRRYFLPIIGKTTRETIPLLLRDELCEHKSDLIDFLTTSDQVRFSNRVPEGFIESLEHYVREFIEDTKPREPSCD